MHIRVSCRAMNEATIKPRTRDTQAAERIRALLIEEDPAYARLLREHLADGESSDDVFFDCEQAGSLDAALARLREGRFQVMVADLCLPDSAGMETFFRLFDAAPQVPIVVLSGLDDKALALQAVQHGAQDYLAKGKFAADVLPRVLRYAVRRKRAEEALRRSEEQLRQAQKMEGIGRLAGGVAHDFNNLLTSILGYSQMVLHALGPHHQLRDDLLQVVHAGERAAALTRQLLAFSRKQMLTVRRLDLNRIVDNMRQLLDRTLGEDIDLTTRLGDDLGSVLADAGQLEQVLLNLAVNARDAMPRGGELLIQTRAATLNEDFCRSRLGLAPGRYALLCVRDTGVGMSDEIRRLIFEPFFTTKDKGTGLGLSMVYGIVKQFGGYVDVESAPGRGAEFLIYLPRSDESPDAGGGAAAATETLSGTETILLVEDEDTLRALAGRILRRRGYAVVEASHGEAALALVRDGPNRPLHLVLTDVVMPHLSGPEMVSRLRQFRDDFKVLYMSGFTDETIGHHGVVDREAHLILKPYTGDALARKVREVLDGA
jgi:two-component system cell cycle sensor histidine kinase/response regulator CckA